jgi:hypothetical protein
MWCTHPPEEMIRLYRGPAELYDDRRLCGVCAEVVYVEPEPARTGHAVAIHRAAADRTVRSRSVP